MLVSLLFAFAVAGFVLLDVKELRAKAIQEDDIDLAAQLPEPWIWAIASFFCGIFTLPIYLYKTRGGQGLAVGIAVSLGVLGFFAIIP